MLAYISKFIIFLYYDPASVMCHVHEFSFSMKSGNISWIAVNNIMTAGGCIGLLKLDALCTDTENPEM